jgi:hypothetical protein
MGGCTFEGLFEELPLPVDARIVVFSRGMRAVGGRVPRIFSSRYS